MFLRMRLRGGAEVKRVTPMMLQLPPPSIIAEDEDVKNTFHICEFQATDQAKAAVKGGLLPNTQLLWLMFIGPFFTILEVGPFLEDQLITCSHKPNHSGDFRESLNISARKEVDPIIRDVYLLGTPEAAARLEFFITYTTSFIS